MRVRGLLFSLLVSATARAEPPAPLPEALFGVKLGAIYQAGEGGGQKVGTFPVAALTGMEPGILGHGSQVYFRPLKENKRFPYVEKKKTRNAKYFNTSFRLYVLPVVTDEELAKAMTAEGAAAEMKWEVALVEWSAAAKDDGAAHAWAVETCKDFALDLKQEPDVVDMPSLYGCTFTSGDREVKVGTYSESKYVKLSFVDQVHEKKEAAVDAAIRKMRMDQTRPY
jgi:hypothetical protein